VVDRRTARVTPANFTEAAQERNIEAGALIRDERFAARLASHFDTLANAGLLRRMILIDPPSHTNGG
jgi:phosphatidylserine/phosphatidylglycerophosphate/cardiolipin synthase-like enzyme